MAKRRGQPAKSLRSRAALQRPNGSGVRLPAGAHPGNTGGKKGRSGRIPNELKLSAQDVGFQYIFPKLERYLKRKNKGPADAGWRWAATTVLDRGFGKVTQPVTGDDEGEPISVRVERERAALARILGRLARIAERSDSR